MSPVMQLVYNIAVRGPKGQMPGFLKSWEFTREEYPPCYNKQNVRGRKFTEYRIGAISMCRVAAQFLDAIDAQTEGADVPKPSGRGREWRLKFNIITNKTGMHWEDFPELGPFELSRAVIQRVTTLPYLVLCRYPDLIYNMSIKIRAQLCW